MFFKIYFCLLLVCLEFINYACQTHDSCLRGSRGIWVPHDSWLKHRYNRYPSFRNSENYHVQRNLVSNIRRKSTCAYFQKNCTSSDSSFFKIIKPFFTNKGHKNSTDMHIQDGDQIVSRPHKVTNIMNDYLVNIASNNWGACWWRGTTPVRKNFCEWAIEKHKPHQSIIAIKSQFAQNPQHADIHGFTLSNVSPSNMKKIMHNLNTKKYTGYDVLPAR